MTGQTFFQNCAKTLSRLSEAQAQDFVLAVCRDSRSGSTINEKIEFIRRLEKEIEMPISKGHICFLAGYEYYTIENGDLYRAPQHYPIMTDGKRCGRWQSPARMVEQYMEMVKG
jgi:hypothetical protein